LANIYLTKKIGCLQPHTQSLSQYSKAFVTLFADFVALATPSQAGIHAKNITAVKVNACATNKIARARDITSLEAIMDKIAGPGL
jgi:BarA-like signal transduction histidine kinase